jgi:hypothetical protein
LVTRRETKGLAHGGVHRAGKPRKRRYIANMTATAAAAIGKLKPGCEIFGFTKGQYSIADVIEHCLAQTGPADCIISTWTASGAGIDRAFELFEKGSLKTCRFLFDASFRARHPEFCEIAVKRFGVNSIRTVRNHAKFVVLRNAKWNLCLRTSMNLNHNPRLENFEISDDKKMARYFEAFVDEVFETFAPDDNFNQANNAGLDLVGNSGPTEADILRAL